VLREQAAQQRRAALVRAALQALCIAAKNHAEQLAEQYNRSKQKIDFFQAMISHDRR
jgi:hypothetical protein